MGEERKPRPRSRTGSASLFSSQPITFEMDVRSPQAAEIKASVSQKLLEFLGSYTDDVLAEYIVVLVCNGKNQNQARDDLEAFLGNKSAEFITWLWYHLFEERHILKMTSIPLVNGDDTVVSSSYADNEHKKSKTASPPSHIGGNSHTVLPIDSKSEPSNVFPSTSSSLVIGKDPECWNHDSNGSLIGEAQPQKWAVQMYSDAVIDRQNATTMIRYSDMRGASEILAGDELGLQFGNHFKKTTRSKSMGGHQHLSPSPEHFPISRNMLTVGTEDPHSKIPSKAENAQIKPSSKAVGAAPCQSIRQRVSVWDRLGKPSEDIEGTIDAKDSWHDEERNMDNGEKRLVQSRSEQCVKGYTLIRRAVVDKSGVTKATTDGNILRRKRDLIDMSHGNLSVSSSGQGGSDSQDKEKPKKFLRSASVTSSQVGSLASNLTAHHASACHSVEDANLGSHLPHGNGKRSEVQLMKEASDFNSAGTLMPMQKLVKPNPLNYAAKNNHVPNQREILDMKLKLQQVEMEMLKLREKQAKMGNESKTFLGSASGTQGAQNLLEDIESRTIFVTNVHFAATKEELSLHFAKCGAIVNVVLLKDAITGLPKGSACVVFATKDSAENALTLNGTSFFSRIVKVMRKADMPVASMEQKQSSGKPSLPRHSQPLKKATFQRQRSGSHLQWRRDQPVNGETTSTA